MADQAAAEEGPASDSAPLLGRKGKAEVAGSDGSDDDDLILKQRPRVKRVRAVPEVTQTRHGRTCRAAAPKVILPGRGSS